MLLIVTVGNVSLTGQACPSVPVLSDVDFSPTDPPCTSGGNYSISNITVLPATPGPGYQYKYSLDGGPFVTNTVFSGIAPGAHCLMVKIFATANVACGGNSYVAGDSIPNTFRLYGVYLGNAGPAALTGAQVVGNLTCANNVNPQGPQYSCWDYEYLIDGGITSTVFSGWVSQGVLAANALSRGCHNIRYRLVPKAGVSGFFGCGTGNPTPQSNTTNFVLFDDLSDDNIVVNTTCTVDGSASGSVTSITGLPVLSTGLTYEYSFDGGAYGTTLPTNLEPGCHNVMIRQAADCSGSVADGNSPSPCRKSYNFVVFPQPPVITPTDSTCNVMFGLPTVQDIAGFSVEYRIDGGAWSASPSTTTPGCHTIEARYVLEAGCSTNETSCVDCYDEQVNEPAAGIFASLSPNGCEATSNSVSVVIFPTAPVITAPTSTCNSSFTLPNVTEVYGFTVQYSIDGGTYAVPASLTIPTTPGCHKVKARYVLKNACGITAANTPGLDPSLCKESNEVSVVIFPKAPVLTAPSSTCNTMFTLPTVTAVSGFSIEYSIDGGTNWSSTPSSTTPGCYSVQARYVLAAACGGTPAGTAGTGECGPSNTVNTVIFPTAPTLTAPTPTCNAMFTLPNVTPVPGFDVEYELNDSGTWESNPSTTLADCYSIRARYVTSSDCGTILAGTASSDPSCAESSPVSTLIYPEEPVINAPANTCNVAFTLPSVNSYTGFTVEYSIDGAAYTSMATAPSTVGCHTVKARYVNTALCGSTSANTPGTIVGADCDESNEVSVVVFPTAPVIGFGNASTTTSTVCESSALPTIFVQDNGPESGDFDLEYSSDNGGTWYTDLASFQNSMDGSGCYGIQTRWTLDGACGANVDGTSGNTASYSCGASNTIYLVVVPDAPVITATDNTCGAMFDLPVVTPLPDFSVEYSIDGGATWSFTPSTTTPDCYDVLARYVTTSSCGPIASGAHTTGADACAESNEVNMLIYPPLTGLTMSAMTIGGNLETVTTTTVTWSSTPTVYPGFSLRYDLDGANSYTNTTGNFLNVDAGCHTVTAAYVNTSACGSTPAGTAGTGACSTSADFVVFPDLSADALRPSITLTQNCGGPVNISTVDIDFPDGYSIPEGMEIVYGGTNNGTPYGPVTLSELTAINFAFNASAPSPGCNTVTAAIRLTEACGDTPAGEVSPMEGWTPFRPFVTFPEAPEVIVPPVCSGTPLTVYTENTPPAGHAWYYRIIDNTTVPADTSAWQNNPLFTNSNIGCYTVEVTPVRTTSCFGITPLNCGGNSVIFPVDPQSAGTTCNPAVISTACLGAGQTCILPEPVMAITPNNITVCLGEEGKIDLQYFRQMVPQCLLDGGAVIKYAVTSSDPYVVVADTLLENLNNLPELNWVGENGENYPNVVTIGVTPIIMKTYDAEFGFTFPFNTVSMTTCTGPEVKFSITVQPNFPVVEPWVVNPTGPTQCEDNTGWVIHSVLNDQPEIEGYTGPFAPDEWNLSLSQGLTYGGPMYYVASIDSLIPDAMLMGFASYYALRPNVLYGDTIQYCVTIPATGQVSFDYGHAALVIPAPDANSWFGYSLNGNITELSQVNAFNFMDIDTTFNSALFTANENDELCLMLYSNAPSISLSVANFFIFDPAASGGSVEGCNYELYFNPSTSPNADPIGNALVQQIVGDGNSIYFQRVYIPGVYEVWERCGQCAEKAGTFEFSIEGFPQIDDVVVEACPNTAGGNTGTFTGLILPLPVGVTSEGVYNTYSGAATGGPDGLVSSTMPFTYTGTTGALYVRVGQDLDSDGIADCFKVATINLSVIDRPIVILDVVEEACVTQPVTATADTYAGSGDGFLYNWSLTPLAGGPTVTATTASQEWTFTTIVPGDYELCVSVNDANFNEVYQEGFTGPFAPANWTFDANGGNGTYELSATELNITSCNDGSGARKDTEVCTTVPDAGVISFDWSYQTIDGPIYDLFSVRVNGVTSTISSFNGSVQSGNVAIQVNAGDEFCFVQESVDCIFGSSMSITNMLIFGEGPVCPTTVCETITFVAPVITCPSDFTVSTDPGTCSAYQNLQPAGVNAACASDYLIRYYTTGATTIGSQASPVTLSAVNAVAFNKGVTTVHAVAGVLNGGEFTAIDSEFASCSYTVNVLDTELPHAQCKSITRYINAAGDPVVITPADIDGGSYDNCTMITFSPESTTFTCANVGQNPVTLTLTDMSGNSSSCVANVTILDIIKPTLTCPSSVVTNVDAGTCGWTASGIGATTTDNCGTPSLTHEIVNPDQTLESGAGDANGDVFAKGTSIVRYTSTDVNGNVSSCLFTVTVNDNILPEIQNCPQDITVTLTGTNTYTVTPSGATGNYVVSVPSTGEGCSVNVSYTGPTASDNCAMYDLRLVQGHGAGTHVYTGGTNVERYVVTDMGGNTAACEFSITVTDERDPVLTCPAPIIIGTNPDYTCTGYAILQPTYNDNCSVATLQHYFASTTGSQMPYVATSGSPVSGFVSGPFYPGTNGVSGVTTVVFIATDAAGNSATCTTTVTVSDDDAPIVSCPLNITVNANGSCDGVLTSAYGSTSTDNCGSTGLSTTYAIGGATTGSGSGSIPVGYAFELGQSQITFTASDANGNTTTCTSIVTVQDVTIPSITCPTVQPTYVVDNGECTKDLTLIATGSDNCSVSTFEYFDPFQNDGPNASGEYAVGVHTIDWVITDGSGNTNQCSVTFKVVDDQLPTITCPSNQTFTTGAGDTDCDYAYSWTHPTPEDNCNVSNYAYRVERADGVIEGPYVLNATSSTIANHDFPKGTSKVRYYVTDASGNQVTCFFTVTVSDDTPPVFVNCPTTSFTIGADANCSNGVIWSIPVASDNCGVVSVAETTAGGAKYGQQLIPGTYNIQYTATDGSGNTAVCNFTINIVDDQTPLIVCPPSFEVATDARVCNWTSAIDELNPLLANDNCPGVVLSYTISGQTSGSGYGKIPSTTFNKGLSTISYLIVDAAGNSATCSFNVTVNDEESPVLTCPGIVTLNTDATECNNTYSPTMTGLNAVDNCTSFAGLSISYSVDNPNNSLSASYSNGTSYNFETGYSQVTYVVSDAAGNSSSCIQVVRVLDTESPVITCPVNQTYTTGSDDTDCAYLHEWTHPTPTDNCGVVSYSYRVQNADGSYDGPFVLSGNTSSTGRHNFGIGVSTVRYYATDASGNQSTCKYTVTVTDDTAPKFVNCPNTTFTIGADANCSNGVVWSIPVATDNCSGVTVSETTVGGNKYGQQLTPGTYNISYTATDANGNTAVCNFTINIVDDQTPLLVCAPSFEVSTDDGVCTWSSAVGELNPLLASDNCPNVVLSYTISGQTSGSGVGKVPATTFNKGTSTITYTLVDSGSNSSTCSFSVTVVDEESPVLSCSPLVTLNTDAGQCNNTFNPVLSVENVYDNCTSYGALSISYVVDNPDNSLSASFDNGTAYDFVPGYSQVIFTARDASGNESSCIQAIRVIDNATPSITCLSDQVFTTGSGDLDCAYLYEWTHPTPTDNCGVTNYSYRVQRADGVIDGPYVLSGNTSSTGRHDFPVGVSTVRYYVQDANGNQSTCKFTVTVTDDTAPSFVQCPVNFQASNSPDICASIVNWPNPIAADNCGVSSVVRTDGGPTQGQPWNLGVYEVRYVATDESGNTAECRFTVTVTDTQNPEIFCPSVTQTFAADKGTCTWNSAGTKAVAPNFTFDNCPATVTYVISGATTASGSGDATGVVFNLGKSTVTYTITGSGNKPFGSCSFDIIIVDEESPVIECANLGSLPKGPWINEFHYDNTGTDAGEFVEIAGPVGFNLSNCAVILYNGSGGAVYDTKTLTGLLGVSTSGSPVLDGTNDGAGVWGTPRSVGDNNAGWAGANAKNVYMTEDANYFYLGADVSAASWQVWAFAIDTKAGGGLNDSWSRQISYGHTNAPDYVFRGTFGGYAELHTWNTLATSWTGYTAVSSSEYAENEGQFVEVRIAKSALGTDRIRNVQFYVTGDQNAHGTFDACPDDEVATSWNQSPKNVLDNYATLPQFATTVINYPSNGIQNGSPDGIALVCEGKVVQFISYEGTFTGVGGAANGMTSTDIAVSQNGSEPLGSSLQFLGGGVNGTWVAATTSSPGGLNAGQVIAPTSSAVFSTDQGKCGATVAGVSATAFDNCAGIVSITNNSGYGTSDASGFYAVGKHTVTFTATDAAGNTTQCSVSFEVKDTESPVVNCSTINPMNPQTTEVVQCESEFAWLHPVPSDNCRVTTYTYTITNPDGTVEGPFDLSQVVIDGSGRNTEYAFEKGTSTVTYFVSDGVGNKNTCSFNVTVADDDKPYFADCPTMIMVSNDPDKCSAKVNWDIPHAFDNCTAVVSVAASGSNQYTPGSIVPVGTFSITYTATDADGNTATCTFQIMVIDTQEPEILVGKPQNTTIDGCFSDVPPAVVLNPNDVEDNCTATPVIGFTETNTRGTNPALCAYYNFTVNRNWTVTDAAGNVERWNQVITVRDVKAPALTTPVDVVVECTGPYVAKSFTCNPSLSQYAPSAAYAQYGVASAVDNCVPTQYLCIEFTETFAPGACGFTGVITRTWTATDPCGNKSTGVQKITIVDKTAPVFTCKAFTIELDATGKGKLTANDVINGGTASVTDNCSANTSLTFQVAKTDFTCADLGANQVLVVVKDACGNESACFATVTVVDKLAPTILCPGDQSFTLASGECNMYWPGAVPTTDNCSSVVTYSPSIATPFGIGTHVITATATDVAGNTTTCKFTLTIKENIPSGTLACNDNVNIALDANCTARINPDMILEGNSYRCFDNYCITITTLGDLPHANSFDITDKDQTFKVSITDCKGTNTSCWGYVTIIETLVPEIKCPGDVTVTCNVDILERDANGKLKLGEAALLTCKPGAKISFVDDWTDNGQCSTPRAIVNRIWTVTYDDDKTVSCTQKITMQSLNLNDIVWPADVAGAKALDCGDVAKTPSLTSPASTGWPMLNGTPVNQTGNLCNVSVNVSDEVYTICAGSYEILRTWKVRNMCGAPSSDNPRVYVQVIKVNDTKGPKLLDCPADVTVGVSAWGCEAETEIPVPAQMIDLCSNVKEFKAKLYGSGTLVQTGKIYADGSHDFKVVVKGLNKGSHLVEYSAKDECGNVTKCYVNVYVIDASAPVAIAKQNVVLSLTNSGTAADGTGKLYTHMVDNGSYDHCTDVKLEIRRLNGGNCGNVGADGTHNNNSTFNNHNGVTSEVPNQSWFHPGDNRNDTDGGEYVQFCCEDIPAGAEFGLHDVELRVWDDGNGNGVVGDNLIINGLRDNYNTTWATVQVENKLAPVLVCPPDVTVTCDMEINLSLDGQTAVADVDLSMTGAPRAFDLCSNLAVSYKDSWVGQSNPVCKTGQIRRVFTVTKGSTVVTCVQNITVSGYTTPFTVSFPQRGGVSEWDNCDFTLEDARNASDSRIKKPVANYGQCDIVGENITIDTFLFEDGACKKWRVTYKYINWCTGEEITSVNGQPLVYYYTYKDEIAPKLACNDQMFAANPNPNNVNGGCEASVVLEATASDALVCSDQSWIKWQGFVDLWANGTVDRLGSSFVNKAWNGIWARQDKLIAGQLNPVWGQLQAQHPNVVLADVVYVTYVAPSAATGGGVKLPAFILDAENISHKVFWKVTDGCGNFDQCENTVMVVDKKAPTPYCVNVSTAIMQTSPKMVELWAKDFDKGSFDNCTPKEKLYFTFEGVAPIASRINEEHYYKKGPNGSVNATVAEYLAGNAYKWNPSSRSAGKVWTSCGDNIPVNVSVWDENFNTDYCTVTLSIIGCGSSILISGTTATEEGRTVNSVAVTAEANSPEFPKTITTGTDGYYQIEGPAGIDYTVSPAKGGDYKNGVTTLDLVMIQRHILGLEKFTSPYKVIASDATNDGKVSASDLTEIRKLILGINTGFKNESWRFPVKGVTLNAENPFPYTDKISLLAPTTDMPNQDFVAVKIGDVNGNVAVNANDGVAEPRNAAQLNFKVNEVEVTAGEVVTIPVSASNFTEVFGYQMTLNLQDATFVGVQPGVLEVTESNIGDLKDKVTMSFASRVPVTAKAEDILFTLTLKAVANSTTSKLMKVTSDVTVAEYYNNTLQVGKVSLSGRTEELEGIELFQNEPNPFRSQTQVSYYMPKASAVKLSIFDVTGKVVAVRNINAVKGLNSEVFTREELGASGVLYYTLECGDFSGTKKMIIVE